MPKEKYRRHRRRRNVVRFENSDSSVESSMSGQSENIIQNDAKVPVPYVLDDISNFFIGDILATSSPVPSDEECSDAQTSDTTIDEIDNALYKGSDISVTQYCARIAAIASKHNLSDAAVSDILALSTSILPSPNRCPSLHQFKNKVEDKSSVEEIQVNKGNFYLLSLQEQLKTIIDRHPDMMNLSTSTDDKLRDITDGSLFPAVEADVIYLIMNTDGFSPLNARSLAVWPILFSVVNLPPSERRQLCNILMGGIFIGESAKPDWNEVLPHIVDQIRQCVIHQGRTVKLKVVALVADLPAKCSISNVMNFNSKFGCTICYVEGKYNHEHSKVLFPITSVSNLIMRTPSEHQVDQNNAERSSVSIRGVKGRTVLSSLITLPTHAPYDVMHLIYLGIGKTLLRHIVRHRLINLKELSSFLVRIKVPAVFRRKPRNVLQDLVHWKAQEHRNYLLYYAVPTLYALVREDDSGVGVQLLVLYLTLSSIIYILSDEAVFPSDLALVESSILFFQRSYVRFFGPSVQTLSLHALVHLSTQVRQFGPLTAVSATPFENVNRLLKSCVTSKSQQGKQMAVRFLRYQSCVSRKSGHSIPIHLGQLKPVTNNLVSEYDQIIDHSFNCADRFRCSDLIFHSFHYGKHLKCASYYAYLQGENRFVKIKFIFIADDVIKLVCRNYVTLSTFPFHDDNFVCPVSIRNFLASRSHHHSLRKGHVSVIRPSDCTHHAIIVKMSDSLFYGVKVINNYEHD